MKLALVCLIVTATSVNAITNIAQYVEFLNKLALNESIIAEQTDFLDRRERSIEEKMGKGANAFLGAPQFSCPTMHARSSKTPENVDSVRLNDLAAIGALGDSLTAGFGAGAHSILELPLDYRGLSFTIGGDSDLMYSATLPNLVNQFSANVIGASTRVAPVWFEYFSNFNVAVSGSTAQNLTEQANELVRRMKTNEHFDSDNEYKMVTIFIGSNDLCDYCQNPTQYSVDNYKKHLIAAIDRLRAGLPNTIVNIVSPIHMELLKMVNKASPYCQQMHKYNCPCLNTDQDMTKLVKQYQLAAHQVAERYQDQKDFTVVVQTFTEKQTLPADGNGGVDFSFFAPDCFHLSHYGHALMAKALFNNILEPVGQKSTKYAINEVEPRCPEKSCPFIRTQGNSETGKCGEFTKSSAPLITGPMSLKKNVPQDTVFAAPQAPQATNAPYIPVVVKDQGSSTALVLVGLTLGLIFGLIIGSVVYHVLQIQRNTRSTVYVSEKTPLLTSRPQNYNSENDNYVQIY